MILIETPVRTLVHEIENLAGAYGEHSQTYCEGAADALRWVMNGGEGPSKTKLLLFKHDTLTKKAA